MARTLGFAVVLAALGATSGAARGARTAPGRPASAVGLRPAREARAAVVMASNDPSLDMWIIQRARLQERFRSELLNRPRRYLPFDSARAWARAMWFTTSDDWLDMVERGEKRNPYLPGRPDEYYKDKGWVGWEDFLHP
jgi:hypothetical protein